MNDKEFENKMLELMKDKAFVEELAKKATPLDVHAFLNEKGISCTLDQVKQLGMTLKEQFSSKELTLDDLDAVSGGGFLDLLKEAASDLWNWIYN